MKTNKILLAALAGGVTYFILGWLVYGIALKGFMETHMAAGNAIARPEAEMVWWALILGNLAFGLLFALIFGRWASISTLATGAKAGAVIGLIMTIAWDFMMYSMYTISDITGIIVDIIVATVLFAIVGAVVAWVLGYKK